MSAGEPEPPAPGTAPSPSGPGASRPARLMAHLRAVVAALRSRRVAVAGVGIAAFAATLLVVSMHRVPEGTLGVRRSDGSFLHPGKRYFALRDSTVALYPTRIEMLAAPLHFSAAGGERLRGRLTFTGTLSFDAIQRIASAGQAAPGGERSGAPPEAGHRPPDERVRGAVLGAVGRALSLREARELVLSSPFALRAPWLPAAGIERALEVTSSEVDLVSVDSLRAVAAGFYKEGGRAAVEPFLDQIAARRPSDSAPVTVRGDLARMEGDASRAEILYLEALELDPLQHAPMEALVVQAQVSGANLERAERLLQRALNLRPESLPHLNWLSLILARRGDLHGAEGALVRALSIAPDDATTAINLASLMDRQERPVEAIEQLRRVLEKHPDHPLALYNLGSALAEQGSLKEAIATLERAASTSRPSARLYARLAVVYEKAGDAARSSEYRQKAEAVARQRQEARTALE